MVVGNSLHLFVHHKTNKATTAVAALPQSLRQDVLVHLCPGGEELRAFTCRREVGDLGGVAEAELVSKVVNVIAHQLWRCQFPHKIAT